MSGLANATKWALIGQIFKLIFRLAVNLILARLISPSEFGLIGMVTVVITLLNSFGELGLFSSIIQKQDITQNDLSSVFWLNFILGVVIAIFLYIGAPLIVSFYREEALLDVMRALAINFVLNSLMITHNAILTKKLSFKRLELYSLIAVAISSTTSLVLAYFRYGVWALVIGQNINYLFNVILVWFFEKWRPSFIISGASLRKMLGFGLKMFLSAIMNTFFGSIDIILIGRYFQATTVGFYSYSQNLINIPVTTFSSAFVRVLFPVMSKVQDDNKLLKTTYKKTLNMINCIIIPGLGAIAVLAYPIVTFFVNPKWTEMVIYVRLIAVIAMLYPISAININILTAKGHASTFLKLEVIKKALFVTGVLLTLKLGVVSILLSILFTSVIGIMFNLYMCGKVSDYKLMQQLKDLMPAILISGVFLLLLHFAYVSGRLIMPDILAMFTSIIIAVPVLLLLFHKYQNELFSEMKRIIITQFNFR